MANTIDGTAKEQWMPRLQRKLRENLVTRVIAEVSMKSDRTFHNPYSSEAEGTDGTVTSPDYNVNAFSTTDDTLAVNRRAVAAEHIDSIERLQSNYNLAMDRADSQGNIVATKIDQYVLNKPVGLSGVTVLDDDDLGSGSDGSPFQLTPTNVDDVLVQMGMSTGLANVDPSNPKFWVVSDYELAKMKLYLFSNGFRTSDNMIEGNIKVGKNGLIGVTPDGVRIVRSNLITTSIDTVLDTSDVTAAQVFTFKLAGRTITATARATPADPGEFDVSGTVDGTGAILANLINDAASGQDSASGYFRFSETDRRLLRRAQVVATYTAGTNTLNITAKHVFTVSTTWTDAAVGNAKRHTLFGEYGSIFVPIPSDGLEYEVKTVGGKHGREIESSQVYEATVWEQMKPGILDVVLYT